MTDKQELRNELSAIEDEARALRNDALLGSDTKRLATLLTRFVKVVREEIVK